MVRQYLIWKWYSGLIDPTVTVLEQAADAHILHRDCSLNNAAIEDLDDGGSRGLLLDWEFGAEVNEDGRYSVGGTVSQQSLFV
jgi:hypothetical protein